MCRKIRCDGDLKKFLVLGELNKGLGESHAQPICAIDDAALWRRYLLEGIDNVGSQLYGYSFVPLFLVKTLL
jgi:hypothetical protein